MQDQVGLHHFFERCPESGNEMVRQIGNKAHRVRQDDRFAMGKPDAAQGRIERGEKHIFRKHLRTRHAVEKRGFSRIGIADKRNNWMRHLAPLLAMQRARAHHGFKLALDAQDFFLKQASVSFDLGFTRAAKEAPPPRWRSRWVQLLTRRPFW